MSGPQNTAKERSPDLCPPFHRGRTAKKSAEKRPESVAWEGFPRANPLRPPTPFVRNF